MRKDDKVSSQSDASGQRRAWSPPRLTRFRAGEAELGANPMTPEGAFAQGS